MTASKTPVPEEIKEAVPEIRLLEGPGDRRGGIAQTLRVAWEMITGLRTLHFVGPCVTVFGSARFKEDHEYYRLAVRVGEELAKTGFTVMTGAGPGIMEAAARGAKSVGGPTVGAGIQLPMEQTRNAYIDTFKEFSFFFVRKLMLVKYSYGFVVMPGGFGTLDEVFEAATLIQTRKIENFPIVLMGTEFWEPMITFMRDTLVSNGTIAESDLKSFVITDDPREAAAHILTAALQRFGVRYKQRPRRSKLLLEFPRRNGT
ncbi:MAG: TIGR00730 family Rossman fold protein [SAR202 cluster bacterium]|nr:TIGR00730 family Rossman fold protein [SAR202 cluster bacterium]